jgi:uncharacterized protein (TIGR00255 family)
MIKSMTGFGKAESTVGNTKITVEVRSLNSKQLDLSLRIPQAYRSIENELRSMAGTALVRGKADIFVNIEKLGIAATAEINGAMFEYYMTSLRTAAEQTGIAMDSDVAKAMAISTVMRMPDVVSADKGEASEEELQALKDCVSDALNHLNAFRQTEGAVLIGDILKRVDIISNLLVTVTPHEQERTAIIKERIRDSIKDLGLAVDENRLEQEMVFYVEKLDITEEKVRLANHCKYFRDVADKEDDPGRKLGFISQEMGREINTLGSKANNSAIQHIVVAMKDELEKIKEQLLNIL